LLQGNAEFTSPADAARPLRFQNLTAHKRAHGYDGFVADSDGVDRHEIYGITRLGAARVDAIAKH
jgi:hypothetical protein